MTSHSEERTPNPSWTLICSKVWILHSTWFVIGLVGLSFLGILNRGGNTIVFIVGAIGSSYGYYRLNGNCWAVRGWRWHRLKRAFPLLYFFCAIAALVGGTVHPPTNFDAFSYRIPRLLHWLTTERWHWIGGTDPRMDFSAAGFEAIMLPLLATFHTLRFAFLINTFSFLLLPGLVFSVFSALGVKRTIAARWMWILPCGSCFAMVAGSIGNDLIATIYVLASIMFSLKAARDGRKGNIILAILAAALMTGAKASNLPLLLPIAICLGFALFRQPQLWITGLFASCIACLVSFLPLAILNDRYTGDWAGDPHSLLKLEDPLAGIAGNALLLTGANLAPAILPPADQINRWFNEKTIQPPLRGIKEHFADFRLTIPQMASEEHSGIGLGVSVALMLGLLGSIKAIHWARFPTLGGMVAMSFGVALVAYMMKLGNCGAPRLISPYYPGLIALFLLPIRSTKVFHKPWFRWSVVTLLFPIVPALILNPARPLLPMCSVIETLKSMGFRNGTLERMETVYSVYAARSDAQESVRQLLPPTAVSIGFAGTSDESEYSFWLPLGTRRVQDFKPVSAKQLPDPTGLDAIVTSNWGCNDRFGMTPEQMAEKLNWQIVGTKSVRTYASGEEAKWSVLTPKKPGTAK